MRQFRIVLTKSRYSPYMVEELKERRFIFKYKVWENASWLDFDTEQEAKDFIKLRQGFKPIYIEVRDDHAQ